MGGRATGTTSGVRGSGGRNGGVGGRTSVETSIGVVGGRGRKQTHQPNTSEKSDKLHLQL